VVEGRVIFGDKAGWMHMVDADNGELISELKIGDNINSTPAILDGRIYIGAFNGKLHCLGMEPNEAVSSQPSAVSKTSPKTR
jgi:outer membrane protein assembly factor BamB